MKLNFFGPINKQGIIRTTNVTTYSNPELTQQQQAYSVTVSPNTAVPGDTFDFVETFEDFE